jgi:hypothetical protein
MNTDALWGGTLFGIEFDVPGNRVSLRVSVLDSGVTTEHLVLCSDVVEFRYRNALPDGWAYAEVTEAVAAFDESAASWVFEAELWADEAGIVVRCRDLSISSTTGKGR